MPHAHPSLLIHAARLGLAALFAAVQAGDASAADGPLYDWGYNGYGQLGNNSKTDSAAPIPVPALSSAVTAISGGTLYSLAIQNGTVYGWGFNGYGQLGNGTATDSLVPKAVTGLSGVTVIAASGYHSLAIENGAAYAWGYNSSGELGNGTKTDSLVPKAVTGLGSGVTAVTAGYEHSLAVRGGAVFAWGDNSLGELGNNSTAGSLVPVAVTGLGSGVTAVATGFQHNLAVQNGTVYAWGSNNYGQLGYDFSTYAYSTVPVAVPGLPGGVTSVAAGAYDCLAVQGGHVFAWGSNDYGQRGDGTTGDTGNSTPVEVDPDHLTNITAVAASNGSSYALAADGNLWVWGYNGSGVLGLGTNAAQYTTPQLLLPPTGYIFSALSGGADSDHILAILTPNPSFFNGAAYLGDGIYYLAFADGIPFGYYALLTNPDPHYLYHFDLGYEYVFNAYDGKAGVYLYDFASGTFFYTSPVFPFPYLYDFTLNTVLYYFPDPNNPGRYNTNGVRYFYNFATGRVVTK